MASGQRFLKKSLRNRGPKAIRATPIFQEKSSRNPGKKVAETLAKRCQNPGKKVPKPWQKHAKTLAKTCKNPGKKVQKPWQKRVQTVAKTCQNCGKNVSKLWQNRCQTICTMAWGVTLWARKLARRKPAAPPTPLAPLNVKPAQAGLTLSGGKGASIIL